MNSSTIPNIPTPSGFVIVDVTTGLYSSGGSFPRFRKTPKIWTKINHVKSHLSMFVGEKHAIEIDPVTYVKSIRKILTVWEPYGELGRYLIQDISTGQTEDVCKYFSKKLHDTINELNKLNSTRQPGLQLNFEIADIAVAIMGAFPQ